MQAFWAAMYAVLSVLAAAVSILGLINGWVPEFGPHTILMWVFAVGGPIMAYTQAREAFAHWEERRRLLRKGEAP